VRPDEFVLRRERVLRSPRAERLSLLLRARLLALLRRNERLLDLAPARERDFDDVPPELLLRLELLLVFLRAGMDTPPCRYDAQARRMSLQRQGV
jgi:hypothetical protein